MDTSENDNKFESSFIDLVLIESGILVMAIVMYVLTHRVLVSVFCLGGGILMFVLKTSYYFFRVTEKNGVMTFSNLNKKIDIDIRCVKKIILSANGGVLRILNDVETVQFQVAPLEERDRFLEYIDLIAIRCGCRIEKTTYFGNPL